MIWLDEPFASLWKSRDVFREVQSIEGKIYRHKEGRKTLRFELDGRGYFLKWHSGVGWKEITKNLLQLRLPILGARDEFNAICKLALVGIDSMQAAGFGHRGLNPATQQSFLITKELTNVISLEDYCRNWKTQPPSLADKQALIKRVADIARRMHENGINHRDFYLCHFLMQRPASDAVQFDLNTAPIYLIDLHRAQVRSRVPKRWLIKDLGALLYSALDIGLTQQDVDLFVKKYDPSLKNDKHLCEQIKQRAAAIYQRDFGRAPIWPS
jgi:heptose I phosphotransferase